MHIEIPIYTQDEAQQLLAPEPAAGKFQPPAAATSSGPPAPANQLPRGSVPMYPIGRALYTELGG